MSSLKQLVLVDGSGYIFRAYYALPNMKRSDGMPVNAVFGFCNMILKLLEDIQREKGGGIGVAIIFDAARKTFRNKIFPDYKANRSEPPEDLIPQFEIIKDIPNVFNIPSIQVLGFEADDLIASYAKKAIENNVKVTVVSSDKDLMQLLQHNISLLDPIKKKELSEKEVLEKFGVTPNKVIDVQALAGDQSDNVPGVPGIGIKTAALLINQFGDLENLLNNCGVIKQQKRRETLENNKKLALISKELVTLRDDVELPISIDDLSFKPLDINKLINFLDDMEFSRIKKQIISKYGIKNTSLEVKLEASKNKKEKIINPKRESISKRNYQLVTNIKLLEDWIKLVTRKGFVAIDCETDSLSAVEAKIVGFSMSLENSRSCYIPLAHKSLNNEKIEQIRIEDFIRVIKPIMEDQSIIKIGQNLKYDLIVLKKIGISCENLDDTMLMSYVLSAGNHGHGLDELSIKYLGHESIKFSDVTKIEKKKVTFDFVPLDKALNYAAEDSDITLRLWEILRNKLINEKLYFFYFYIEKPLIKVITEMEISGIKIDIDNLKDLSEKFKKKIIEIEESIFLISKEKFNVGSPKQLGEILFQKLSLPNGKKGKSGNYQTDVSVLEKLKNEKIPIAGKILEWRQFNKLLTTYCEGLIARENLLTSRIHTSFGMASTNTGRLSSNAPNLQNIPIKTQEGKEIRRAFVADIGYKIVSIDYSQIELRILAHVAKIQSLQDGFRKNHDIHSLTAMDVFQVDKESVTEELRRKAKTINFGIIYGISPFGLANQLDISNTEAKDYIDKYFNKYPGIRKYMTETVENCKENGFVKTPFGRKISIPLINDKIVARRNFAERSAINAPIQGGAADMIKRSMIKVSNYLEKEKLKTKMLLQVHDELIFEIPENEISFVPKKIAKIMENASEPILSLSVPLKADIGIGLSWADAH